MDRVEKIIKFVSDMTPEKNLKPSTVYQVYFAEHGSNGCVMTSPVINLFKTRWAVFVWLFQNAIEFSTYNDNESMPYGWNWRLVEVL